MIQRTTPLFLIDQMINLLPFTGDLTLLEPSAGDAELDMWLTRTYLEGGGGGNAGESYLLAWYFAAFHTRTDSMDKRGQKGFIFTVGDEPNLKALPMSSVRAIMGSAAQGQTTYTEDQLLKAAQENYHVYHIHVNHSGRFCNSRWKELLGKNLIEISDHTTLSHVISELILSVVPKTAIIPQPDPVTVTDTPTPAPTEEML